VHAWAGDLLGQACMHGRGICAMGVEGETCYKLALQERPIISTYC
jgi:hypothetical protein